MDESTTSAEPTTVGDLHRELVTSLALPVGSSVVLVLPMFLSPLRSLLPRAVLVAVIGVVALLTGLLGGRGAALSAAGVAALSFDAFLTETHGSLRPGRLAFWTTLATFVFVALLGSALRSGRR